jgi:hypothetical protein
MIKTSGRIFYTRKKKEHILSKHIINSKAGIVTYSALANRSSIQCIIQFRDRGLLPETGFSQKLANLVNCLICLGNKRVVTEKKGDGQPFILNLHSLYPGFFQFCCVSLPLIP